MINKAQEGVPKKPSVALLILNWNGKDDTLECLASLDNIDFPRENAGIFVIDNGSTDGSPGTIKTVLETMAGEGWYETGLFTFETNLGFGPAYNRALEELDCGYDYLYCSNNDIAFCPNTLAPLVELLEQDSRAGIAGPRVMSYAEPDKLAHGAGFIKAPFCRPSFQDTQSVTSCDFVTGCAMLVRMSLIKELEHLFDPDFFAYWEDTDLCARARALGYNVAYNPEAKVLHKVSAATSNNDGRDMNPARIYYKTHSKILFARKHLSKPARLLFLALYGLRIPAFALRSILLSPKNCGTLIRSYLSACAHGMLGRPGKPYKD